MARQARSTRHDASPKEIARRRYPIRSRTYLLIGGHLSGALTPQLEFGLCALSGWIHVIMRLGFGYRYKDSCIGPR